MKKNPMVTISLPCYNHEKFVRESIESVLAQTYQDFELVIIENGSTDHSKDIIKEYEDRATVIYFEKNDIDKSSEVFQQETRGKYHAIMTSDDIWMPDKLEKQIAFLEDHPEYQACFTWAEYGDENMNTLYDYTYKLFKQENQTSAMWLRFFWENGNVLCAPSMVMRRENYLDNFRRTISYHNLFDLAGWVRFLLAGNQLYIYPQVLVKMRKHNAAISYSEDAMSRAIEEQSSICIEIMEQISDELFRKGFGSEFMRSECKGHEELTCEKILFFFTRAEKNLGLRPRAFDFFYKHYSDDKVAEIFKEKYNMDKKFFSDLTKDIGMRSIADYYYNKGREDAIKDRLGKDAECGL